MHQQIAVVNNSLSLNWRFSSRNLSIGILQVATLSLPPLLIFPFGFFFERALRGDVKNGSFGWCPPQNDLYPPQLWSNYHFFVEKLFVLRIPSYGKIFDQI